MKTQISLNGPGYVCHNRRNRRFSKGSEIGGSVHPVLARVSWQRDVLGTVRVLLHSLHGLHFVRAASECGLRREL